MPEMGTTLMETQPVQAPRASVVGTARCISYNLSEVRRAVGRCVAALPDLQEKFRHAGRVLLKPAPDGSGVIAGGGMRPVLEAAGVRDVIGKSLGSKNRLNVVKATIASLQKLRSAESIAAARA